MAQVKVLHGRRVAAVLGVVLMLSSFALPTAVAVQTQATSAASSSTSIVVQRHALPLAMLTRDDLEAWLVTSGASTLLVESARIFHSVPDEQRKLFSYGNPIGYTQFAAEKTGGDTALVEANSWVVPIFDGDGAAIGVTIFNPAGSSFAVEASLDDELLGSTAANLGAGETLVRDRQLNGWFKIADGTIEAASTDGENVLLGRLPVEDFISQRDVNVYGAAESSAVVTVGNSALASSESGSNLTKLLALLVALGVLAISLAWLAWERRYLAQRQDADDLRLPQTSNWQFVDYATRRGLVRLRQPKREEIHEVLDD